MHRNKSVDVHRFAMIPRADIPRASFKIQKTHKTTFDSGFLIPIYLDEVLPGDTMSCRLTAFVRLATCVVSDYGQHVFGYVLLLCAESVGVG